MFGDTDNIRTKTEDDLNNTGCYGGFGNRFSYEQCRRAEAASYKKTKLVFFLLGVCLVSFSVMLLCAVVLVRIVESNRSLYFPSAVYTDESHRVSAEESPLRIAADSSDVSGEERLVNVSSEESARYRIPVGVMVKAVEPDSEAHILGIETGDIIVAVNDVAVSDIETLNLLVDEGIGQAVTKLTVFRDNSYCVLSVISD